MFERKKQADRKDFGGNGGRVGFGRGENYLENPRGKKGTRNTFEHEVTGRSKGAPNREAT